MILTIMLLQSGVVTISSFFTIRESYAPTLLKHKAAKLRKETGNQSLRSFLDQGKSPRELFMFSIFRPTKMLFLSPIVFMLSMYVAIIYGYLYLLFTTISQVFEEQYHWSQGSVGLAYLGIGIGSIIGISALGLVSDRLLAYLTKKNGGSPKPEYRLPPMFPGTFLVPAGLFIYGWTAYYKTHWIVPIFGTSLLGVGMLIAFVSTPKSILAPEFSCTNNITLKMTVSTYLVDAFTIYAASAMAANTVFRSLTGALLPLAGPKMYQALGLGWGNSVLGFIAVAFAPLPLLFYLYGERIRTSKRFQVEF